jgi:RNA polymerase sigma factor (sigma-70 family)
MRPEQQLEASSRRQTLTDVVYSLEPDENEVVRELYLETDGRRARTKDVASRLGCSASRVIKLEKRALNKLRRKPYIRDLLLDLDR